MMRALGGVLSVLILTIYICIGFVQLSAIASAFQLWWGIGTFSSYLLGAFLGYMPLVGAIIGMIGAMEVWHWEWWQAGGLFFGGLLLTIVLIGVKIIRKKRGR